MQPSPTGAPDPAVTLEKVLRELEERRARLRTVSADLQDAQLRLRTTTDGRARAIAGTPLLLPGVPNMKPSEYQQLIDEATDDVAACTEGSALLNRQIATLERREKGARLAIARDEFNKVDAAVDERLAELDRNVRAKVANGLGPLVAQVDGLQRKRIYAWAARNQALKAAGEVIEPAYSMPTLGSYAGFPDLREVVELVLKYAAGNTLLQSIGRQGVAARDGLISRLEAERRSEADERAATEARLAPDDFAVATDRPAAQ